jgi:hypothetical protein
MRRLKSRDAETGVFETGDTETGVTEIWGR